MSSRRSLWLLPLCLLLMGQDYNVPFRPRAAGGGDYCTGFQFCNNFEITDPNCTPDEIGQAGEAGRATAVQEDDAGELACDSAAAAVEGSAGLRIDGISTTFSTVAFAGVDNAVLDSADLHYLQFCHKESTTSSSAVVFDLVRFRSAGAAQSASANGVLEIEADGTPQLRVSCNDGAPRSSAYVSLPTPTAWHALTVMFDEVVGANFQVKLWIDTDPSAVGADATIDCFGANPNADGHVLVWNTFTSGPHTAVVEFDKVRWKTGSAPGALTCP